MYCITFYGTKLFRVVKTKADCKVLQKDLSGQSKWAAKWKTQFNVNKCKVMQSCLWNLLPQNVTMATGLDSFKRRLDTFMSLAMAPSHNDYALPPGLVLINNNNNNNTAKCQMQGEVRLSLLVVSFPKATVRNKMLD